MRGRLTAMPLAKSRKATPMASMQSRIGRSRWRSSSVMMMVTHGSRSVAPLRRAGQPIAGLPALAMSARPARVTSIHRPRKDHAMTDDIEDHCWKDVISPEVLDVYACYKRKTFVGQNAALLPIEL